VRAVTEFTLSKAVKGKIEKSLTRGWKSNKQIERRIGKKCKMSEVLIYWL
jgi:predicted DNA-binding ArsR family transcriptional regulator